MLTLCLSILTGVEEKPSADLPFFGDSALIESRIRNRPELNVGHWEFCLKRRAGQSSANVDKLTFKGKWGAAAILIGFQFNAESNMVSIPQPMVIVALPSIRSKHFATIIERDQVLPP